MWGGTSFRYKAGEYFNLRTGILLKVGEKLFKYLFLRTDADVCEYMRGKGLKIGDNTHIGNTSFGSEPYLIEIGDNVYFSGGVSIITHDGATMQLYYMGLTHKKFDSMGIVKICDNCFIGAKSIILKNVTIGQNCIIGAGSIVTKNIPNNSVVAGVPAKVICTVEEYFIKNQHNYSDTFGMPYEKKKEILMDNYKIKA